MRFVKLDLGKEFITALKGNRKIKLLDVPGAHLQAVESLKLEEGNAYRARLEGVPLDVVVVKLVFKHEGSHDVVQFLCSSATSLRGEEVRLGYQKRWPVEEQREQPVSDPARQVRFMVKKRPCP